MIDVGPRDAQLSRAQQIITFGQLTIDSDRDGAVHTIALRGEIDIANADRVQQELERVEATDVTSIILDLSELTFIDSTGIRVILLADARSRKDSHRLSLCRGPAAVQRVFQLTGLEDRLPFAD